MKLDVQIEKHELQVICEIEVTQASYTFALSHTFELYNIQNNGRSLIPTRIDVCELQFRPKMKKYQFTNLEKGTLAFSYHGSLEGYFLYMQEEVFHFSMYNGWYPIGFDVVEEYDLVIHCDESYELINGTYDPILHCWTYSTRQQEIIDCNILLLHKYRGQRMQNEFVKFYDLQNRYHTYMQALFHHYTSVCQFYEELYGHNEISFTHIVFLPEKYELGAYKRDHLIVFTEMNRSIEEEQHHLAHEMAHSYAKGADVTTWEDWLNETHAEWSALLYEEAHHPELFVSILTRMKATLQQPYCLNPEKEKRPEQVHEIGTLIYYELYQRYGTECIKTLLRTFDQLEKKDSASFFALLNQQNQQDWVKHIQSYIN